MQCDRARPLLGQLIDGALGPLRRLFVTRHLTHCAACSAQLEEMQSMQAAIRSNLPYHRAPPGLAVRIGARLPREDVPVPSRSWLRVPALQLPGERRTGRRSGRRRVDVAGGRRRRRGVKRHGRAVGDRQRDPFPRGWRIIWLTC